MSIKGIGRENTGLESKKGPGCQAVENIRQKNSTLLGTETVPLLDVQIGRNPAFDGLHYPVGPTYCDAYPATVARIFG